MTHAPALMLALAMITGSVPEGGRPVDQTSIDALVRRIETLEERRAGDTWLTQRRADEIRALVGAVLADADVRVSALRSTLTAGWDRGFFIAAADESFRLRIEGYLQVRYAASLRDDSGDDDTRSGFELRRTRVKFRGHVIDPSWQYSMTISYGRSDGVARLSDGFLLKTFDDTWYLKAGQFKPPLLREELMSAKRQLAVDRSLVTRSAAFNQGRAQGVEAGFEGERLRGRAMVSDGLRSANTGALEEDTELALTGRAEWLAAGTWKQFRDFSAQPGDGRGALLGAAIHYQRDEYGTARGPEEKRLIMTADASLELSGVGVFAAVNWEHNEADGRSDRDRIGVVAQGGAFVTERAELFARYEWGDYDEPGVADLSVLTAGFNWFIDGHRLKLTTDVGYAFKEIDEVWASGGASWLADAPGRDGQVVVRSQLQLLF
jgi:hypothetical protein